jgi:ATP-dependent protease HslVU (ClpYQ) peptidase subunit
MSCVIGIIDDGKIYMGADSYATTGEGEIRPVIANKLFFNRDYLIGYTGSVRGGQVLMPGRFDPPPKIEDMPDTIRDHLYSKGCVMDSEEHGQIQGCNFLIGFQGKIYEILIDFQLNETRGSCNAIGAGSTFAFGSLYTTSFAKNITPHGRIMMALNAASFYTTTCGPPFIYESIE